MLGVSEAFTCSWPGASLIKAGAGAPLSVILRRIGCASEFDNHCPQPFCNLGKNEVCHIPLKKVASSVQEKRWGIFLIQILGLPCGQNQPHFRVVYCLIYIFPHTSPSKPCDHPNFVSSTPLIATEEG